MNWNYLDCPRCGADEGMGLSGIPGTPGRLAVWCCICGLFGPDVSNNPPSREADTAAVAAWNSVERDVLPKTSGTRGEVNHSCCDCEGLVPVKRVQALLSMYPPVNGGNRNLPSVPLRCIACAEVAVKPFRASGSSDESGTGWVLDYVGEERAF